MRPSETRKDESEPGGAVAQSFLFRPISVFHTLVIVAIVSIVVFTFSSCKDNPSSVRLFPAPASPDDATPATAWAPSIAVSASASPVPCHLPASRVNASWPIYSIDPPISFDRDRDNRDSDVSPSIFLPMDRIWESLEAAFPGAMSNFVVNVGTANGVDDDPLWPLMQAHGKSGKIGGVFVEFNPEAFGKAKASYAQFPHAQMVHAAMYVSSATETARGSNTTGGPYPSDRKSVV